MSYTKTITIEIDGNDGVGKTYTIAQLRTRQEEIKHILQANVVFKDRGALTLATDSGQFIKEPNHIYIILDASIYYCQDNILKRGDSIEEKYHTKKDLEYYRNKFLTLAMQYNIPVVFKHSNVRDESTIFDIMNVIKKYNYD